MTRPSVQLMSETDAHTVCVRLDGAISGRDFDAVFLNAVRERFESSNNFSALLYFTNHRGWEEEAAELSFDSILRYGVKAKRIAYVDPPSGKIMQVKIFQKQLSGEVRIFDKADLDQAIRWAKTGKE